MFMFHASQDLQRFIILCDMYKQRRLKACLYIRAVLPEPSNIDSIEPDEGLDQEPDI